MMRSRAQVSLEFLIILAAFLAFLAVWIPVLGKINDGAQQGIATGYAKESAARLAAALDDVCMLGEGNVRLVEMRLAGPARVEGKGKKVFVVSGAGGYAVSADRLCGSGSGASDSGNFVLELEGSTKLKVWSEAGSTQVQVIKE
ncbi:MAG: class III signal peptide-containing protein [Candidatus Burarchaeum sp.]|nr:class III signal peptide-containing protein [Candidatus Burarchaeum sp.]MDO8339029.1 class III signal peptide-containing protein [Candidatus Burarchaeum sp.]